MPESRVRSLPRVLFAARIDPSHKLGSFEEQTFALSRAFQERSGLFLPLYTTGLGPIAGEDYRAHGLRAESLDLSRFRFSTLARLATVVREHEIEVVHWNFYEPIRNGYVWGLSLLTPSVRHFFTDHTSRPTGPGPGSAAGRFRSAGKRLVFRRYEKVFGVSDFVSNSLQGGRTWRNVVRWAHLVNTDRFSPDPVVRREVRDRHGVGQQFVALVVAQLIPEKGVDVAIRAIQGLPDRAELWVVGGGSGAAGLEALARDLEVGDRVRFFGVQRDVSPLMRSADCLVCPSIWAEAAGLVNIEALACGLPVVASRIGGIPELIDDGRTGILFPPGDVGRLTEALRTLQADPDSLRAMASAAREAALNHYSIQNRIDDYLDYYRNPVEAKSAHADAIHAIA